MADVTRILKALREGQSGAADELSAALYEDLRSLARREMLAERREHTLQPTAVVHEAYLRLVSGAERSFESRAHFMAAAATAIRRVLVDHARMRTRLKRGDGAVSMPLDELDPVAALPPEEFLDLDEALSRLASVDPLKARVVELRFFAGMEVEELAQMLGTSASTVRREWRTARAWLRGELDGPHAS